MSNLNVSKTTEQEDYRGRPLMMTGGLQTAEGQLECLLYFLFFTTPGLKKMSEEFGKLHALNNVRTDLIIIY